MAADAPTAFFSYSRDDSEFTLRLAEDLKAAGANVWLDRLDIAPGERWDRSIEDALTTCPRMLVVLSPSSINSTNVLDEVSFALENQKTVIPVLYRDCAIPFRLRRIQYLDFRTDYAHGLRSLLEALQVERSREGGNPSANQAQPDVAGVVQRSAADLAWLRKQAADQARPREPKPPEKTERPTDFERQRAPAEQPRLEQKHKPVPEIPDSAPPKYPRWAKIGVAVAAVILAGWLARLALFPAHEQKGEPPNPDAHASQTQEPQTQTTNPPPSGQPAKLTPKTTSQPPATSRPSDSKGSTAQEAQPQPQTPQGPPAAMRVCNNNGNCTTWTWNSGHYDGVWQNAITATMAVVSFTPESVVINRTDYGRTVGYTAVYTGKISSQGNSILNGQWSDNKGHTGWFTAAWGAALPLAAPATHADCALAVAQNLPTRLTECEAGQCQSGGGPGDWTFRGRQGHAVWRRQGAVGNLTIERFDSGGVVIHREDMGGRTPGMSATYTGKIKGNRIEGDVTWSWPGHWTKSPHSTWYATIDEPANYSLLDPSVCP